MDQKTTLLRSWMFVPGDRQRMIDKSLALPVDAIMMDIEDGVAPDAKEPARRQIAASLDQVAARADTAAFARTPARFVRINAVGHQRMHDDLAAVVRPGLEGLAVAKVETPDQVKVVEKSWTSASRSSACLPAAYVCSSPLKARAGSSTRPRIASASPRVIGLMFGAEDFCRELSLPLRREGEARDLSMPARLS